MFLGIVIFSLVLLLTSNDHWSDKPFTPLCNALQRTIVTDTADLVVNNTDPNSHSPSLKCSDLWFLSFCSIFTVHPLYLALWSVSLQDVSVSSGWISQLNAPASRSDGAPKCDSMASTKPWITALSSPVTPWIIFLCTVSFLKGPTMYTIYHTGWVLNSRNKTLWLYFKYYLSIFTDEKLRAKDVI